MDVILVLMTLGGIFVCLLALVAVWIAEPVAMTLLMTFLGLVTWRIFAGLRKSPS